jgi:hypothetical protein
MTALVSLALLTVAPAAPVPRESDARRVARLWGDWVDPDKGSSFTLTGSRLRVVAGRGPRGLNPLAGLNNAPRTLKTVSGDFTATVTIHLDTAPAAAARGGPDYTLSGGGGLLLWVGDDLHLRLSRSQWLPENGQPGKTTYNLRGVAGGEPLEDKARAVPPETRPVTMRLVRAGKTVRSGYSFDGKTWEWFDDTTIDLPAAVKVGVYAAHNFDRPLAVEFGPMEVAGKK